MVDLLSRSPSSSSSINHGGKEPQSESNTISHLDQTVGLDMDPPSLSVALGGKKAKNTDYNTPLESCRANNSDEFESYSETSFSSYCSTCSDYSRSPSPSRVKRDSRPKDRAQGRSKDRVRSRSRDRSKPRYRNVHSKAHARSGSSTSRSSFTCSTCASSDSELGVVDLIDGKRTLRQHGDASFRPVRRKIGSYKDDVRAISDGKHANASSPSRFQSHPNQTIYQSNTPHSHATKLENQSRQLKPRQSLQSRSLDQPKCQDSSKTSIPNQIYGRRISPNHFADKEHKKCEFVKRVSQEQYQNLITNPNEAVPYQFAKDISLRNASLPTDPRNRRNYLDKLSKQKPSFTSVLLTVDENWVGELPPKRILVKGIGKHIVTKAQLLGYMESHISRIVASEILDINLFRKSPESENGIASIEFKTYQGAIEAIKEMEKKSGRTSNYQSVIFDSNGMHFQTLKDQMENTIQPPLREPPKFKPANRPTCDPIVPCICIDYEFFPKENSTSQLAALFKDLQFYTIERGNGRWHVHFTSLRQVAQVYERRYEFMVDGKRIRPYPLPLETVKRFLKTEEKAKKAETRKHFDAIKSIDDSLKTIDALSSLYASQIKNIDIIRPKQSATTDPYVQLQTEMNPELLSSLPKFHRRHSNYPEKDAHQPNLQSDHLSDLKPSDTMPNKHRTKHKRHHRKRVYIKPGEAEDLSNLDGILEKLAELPTGSARTEGYFKQPLEEKIVWMDRKKSKALDMEDKFGTDSTAAIHSEEGKTGRTSRVLNRRVASVLNEGLLASEFANKFTAFQSRKKQLILNRSSIHSFGLFAGEYIECGDMVIEYVGEMIRHSVANERERRYERALRQSGSTEIASSYLFRLDEMWVIDATAKGNLARFINHSCEPNCVARIVLVDGARRIVMYAKRNIYNGEEITYDYKFPIEDDPAKKIRCLCGHPTCRGFLN